MLLFIKKYEGISEKLNSISVEQLKKLMFYGNVGATQSEFDDIQSDINKNAKLVTLINNVFTLQTNKTEEYYQKMMKTLI
jgi:hypothetical protein